MLPLIPKSCAGAAVCAALLVCRAAHAQPITSEMRAADPRLEKSVSIVEKEIFLGELLDRAGKQTCVAVRLDQDDAGANATVLVSIARMSLADLLNALWSVTSFQKAEWRWDRSGAPGSFSYMLMRPGPARDLPDKLKAKIQTDFDEHVSALKRAAAMPAEARKKLSRGNPADDAGVADSRVMSAIAIFASALSADDQRAVLQDGARRMVDTSGLSADAQQFISKWAEGGALPPYVAFIVHRPDDAVAPNLFMNAPHGNTEGGYNYAGGVPLGQAEAASLAARWLLPGDDASSDLEKRTVSVTPRVDDFDFNHFTPESTRALNALTTEQRVNVLRTAQHALETQFIDLSHGASLPVVAILSPAQQHSGQLANGDTVSAFLRRVNPDFMHQVMVKWRDGTLVLCSPSWFYHCSERMAWSTVTGLRRLAADGVPLAPLLRVLERVTRAQMITASDEFPFLKALLPAQNLFALYYKYPQVLAGQGLPITVGCLEEVKAAVAAPEIDWRPAMTLYLTEAARSDGETAINDVLFRLIRADGSLVWAKEVLIKSKSLHPKAGH